MIPPEPQKNLLSVNTTSRNEIDPGTPKQASEMQYQFYGYIYEHCFNAYGWIYISSLGWIYVGQLPSSTERRFLPLCQRGGCSPVLQSVRRVVYVCVSFFLTRTTTKIVSCRWNKIFFSNIIFKSSMVSIYFVTHYVIDLNIWN